MNMTPERLRKLADSWIGFAHKDPQTVVNAIESMNALNEYADALEKCNKMNMAEQELRAEFEREYRDEFGSNNTFIFYDENTFYVYPDASYSNEEVFAAYQMWKRAKQQSEQRIAELEQFNSQLRRTGNALCEVSERPHAKRRRTVPKCD